MSIQGSTVNPFDCQSGMDDGAGYTGLNVSVVRDQPREVPELFPVSLLTNPEAVPVQDSHELGGQWWLAHTRPRQEKAVVAALWPRRVPYYLPLITRKSLSRGRTRVARIPLFPGYVFVYGSDEERLQVLKTNRVLALRQVVEGEMLRRDLLQFAELIALGAPLVPEARLVAGDRVRIKAGPFRGKEGVVLRRNGKTRLLIAVNYLQQGASLEIDDCFLEFV
jgi:transcriptional antiterminator RfaH